MQAADDNPGPRRAATSVLISVNDLEAVAIKQLAAAAGATVVDLALDWGGQPASAGAPFDINALEDSIILVETPDIALEEALRAAGKIVRVVDHHIYLDREGQLLDRSASRSSLEQVARLLGFESPLTRAIVTVGAATFGAAAIAANDSGYWPGVMRHYLETGEPDRLNEGCIVFTDPAAPDIDLAALAGKAARYAKQALNAVVQLRDAEIRLRAEVQGKPARPIREWFNLLDEAQLRLAVLPTRSGGGDPGRTLRLLAVGEACRGAPIGDWLYHRIVQERIDAITDPDHQLHESLVSAKDGRLLLNLAAMAAPVDMLIVQLGRSASGPAQTGCPPEDLAACPVQDLFFSGGPGARDLVMDMMRMAGPGEAFDGLSLYAGAGSDAVFLGAGGGPDQAHALSRLADTLLEALLTGARPLTQWRTHIIQGLQPGSEQASGLKRVQAVKPAKAAAGKPGLPVARPMTFEPNERAYFLDHLRNRLLGPPAPAEPHCMDGTATAPDINWMELDWRSFEIMSPGDAGAAGGETPPASGRPGFLEVEWGAIAEGADGDGIEIHRRLRAKISAIRVHFAFNQVVFIECEVEGAPWPNYSDGAPLWRQILTHQTPVGEPVTLADLLDFNELARQCYSAWEHGGGERRRVRLLDADGQPIAGAQTIIQSAPGREEPEHPHGWFAALARDALAPWRLDPSHLRFIHDERARIVSSALPAGSAPRGPYGEARHTVMLARFAGVDAFDEAFLYDPDFSRRELALQSYDRFAATGSYFATSGHALTLLGYGWFPREHIKKAHVAAVHAHVPDRHALFGSSAGSVARNRRGGDAPSGL